MKRGCSKGGLFQRSMLEVGVDESGRGPLMGRVYAAAVCVRDGFDVSRMKDSKKFSKSKKSQRELYACAEYIRENAFAWGIAYEEVDVIDSINILQATQQAMHKAIAQTLKQIKEKEKEQQIKEKEKQEQKEQMEEKEEQKEKEKNLVELCVDGTYFREMDADNMAGFSVSVRLIPQGDALMPAISAASILAKTARDSYIVDLCNEHPELQVKYGLLENKGYGTKRHMEGIKQHGISAWHRTSFAPCKNNNK